MQGYRTLFEEGNRDDRLQQQIRSESKKWSDILKRIIVTLPQQNLALRGHQKSISKDLNPRNFLALIKDLSKFDIAINAVESISAMKGHLSYFSHNI